MRSRALLVPVEGSQTQGSHSGQELQRTALWRQEPVHEQEGSNNQQIIIAVLHCTGSTCINIQGRDLAFKDA